MRRLLFLFAFISVRLVAQTPAPFAGFDFLLGIWNAATSQGSAGASALGTYTFQADLGGTVITRTSSADSCNGPANFDCQHHDILTIYREIGDAIPHALYADNEGPVLHYDISSPDAKTAVFITTGHRPKFRLMYHLEGSVMTGKFQIEPPGATESSHTWSGRGTKK